MKVHILRAMNKLAPAKRVQILSMLVEGSSMRSIARVADVSINTVSKMLVDAGKACAAFHDEAVRGVQAKRMQCDEIWSFTYAKAKNVPNAKAAPEEAGDTWRWTALDSDSKLIVSYLVGGREATYEGQTVKASPYAVIRASSGKLVLHAVIIESPAGKQNHWEPKPYDLAQFTNLSPAPDCFVPNTLFRSEDVVGDWDG